MFFNQPMFRRVFVIFLLLGQAWASPASDLLNQAIQLLQQQYGGFSRVSVVELAEKYQKELEAVCANEANCPYSKAAPLVRQLVGALGDEHTNYYSPEDFDLLQRQLTGAPGTKPQLGIVTQVVPGLEGLLVIEAYPGTPAQEAGLKRGDRLLAVNGAPFPAPAAARQRWLIDQVQSGQELKLLVWRKQAEFEISLKGRILPQERPPSLSLREDGVAVLRIPSFTPILRVGQEVHNLVREARLLSARAMVVDLRDNPGGVLSECMVAAGAFVPDIYRAMLSGPMYPPYELYYREGTLYANIGILSGVRLYSVQPAFWQGKVAVLVNASTASCAEYFALDLLESRTALVVGEPTRGLANTASAFSALMDGSGLQITTSRALRSDGSAYPERVTPEIPAADDLLALATRGYDAMLEEAVFQLFEGR